jgi:hypothetical protein
MERWSDLMEEQINAGHKVETIADSTANKADITGITGFMFAMAVKKLSQFWIYGEELHQWHNKKYNSNSANVVNPCILT